MCVCVFPRPPPPYPPNPPSLSLQFWDVWRDPSSPGLKHTIRGAPDPHEAKWICARQFGYKMATTFMPGYAKGE
jgi:hypothetical protein